MRARFLSLAMAGTSAMAGMEARREAGRGPSLTTRKWVVSFAANPWSIPVQMGGQLQVQSDNAVDWCHFINAAHADKFVRLTKASLMSPAPRREPQARS
jgi:hypothetical protein